MAQMVYDLIKPSVLLDYTRAFDNEVLNPDNAFKLGEYLPDVLTDDLEFRIRKAVRQDVDAAEFRAFDTPAVMSARPGTMEMRGSLGPVSRQIPLGEEELLRTRALERNTDDPLIQAILDDAENMVRSVKSRLELARGDVIDDGKVTIGENGLQLEADFGRDASMRKTASTVHSNPAALVVTDLLAWAEAWSDMNGADADHILMPKQTLGYWLSNTEVRNYSAVQHSGYVPNRVTREEMNSILLREGLPPIRTYDATFRVDGVKTRVLPADKIYFMPSGACGATHYGTTAEAIKLRSKGYIKKDAMPGIVAVVTEDDHPVQTYTVGTALALPSIDANSVLDAEVL